MIILLTSLLGSLMTYELSKVSWLGSIRSSCLLTLIFWLDLNLLIYFDFSLSIDLYLAAFFGGTFIGMSSHLKFSRSDVVFASIIYSGLFVYFLPLVAGLGGALGFSAFISIGCIYLAKLIYSSLRPQSLSLRKFTLNDKKIVSEMLKHAEMMKTTGFGRVQSDEEVMSRLEEWSLSNEIWCAVEGEVVIGWGMLKESHKSKEIGYMVHYDHWNKGHGKLIAKKLLEFTMQGDLVTAKVDHSNIASIKILEALGFSKVSEDEKLSHFSKKFN